MFNFVFTAAHINRTAYIGYLTLNFQESKTISYEAIEDGMSVLKTNVMVTNKIEVRIDMYILGDNGAATNTDYSVIMKTEIPDDKSSGHTDIMIPTGIDKGEVYITGVDYTVYELPEYYDDRTGTYKSPFEMPYNDGTLSPSRPCKIYVTAITNQNNTTGWSSTGGQIECSPGMQEVKVGTLIGSISATVRYSLQNFTYYEDYRDGYQAAHTHDPDHRPQFVLHFRIDMPDGTQTYSNITVTLVEKNKINISFYDRYRDPDYTAPIVRSYYEGTMLTESLAPSTGPNFIGWYYKNTNFTNEYDYGLPITKPMELEARYTYVVTFDNGNNTSYIMYVAASDGGALLSRDAMPVPTMTGYEFKYWCIDEELNRQWDYTSDRVTGDMTLYAKWSGKEIKVRFWYKDIETSSPTLGQYISFSGMLNTGDPQYSDRNVTPIVIDGHSYYIMKWAGSTPVWPTVNYGSTFNTIDPYQSGVTGNTINILDFAESQVKWYMESNSNNKFICWQAKKWDGSVSYPVYKDTPLTGDMARDSSGNIIDYIDLYAITATVAVKLNMTDTSEDVSVHINAPSEFLVYPDDPLPYTTVNNEIVENTRDVYGYDNTIYVYDDTYPAGEKVRKWMQGTQVWDKSITEWSTVTTNGDLLFKWSNDANGSGVNADKYTGSMRYYKDTDGNWYQIEDWNYKHLYEDDSQKWSYDKYGNTYLLSGGTWVKQYSSVFNGETNFRITHHGDDPDTYEVHDGSGFITSYEVPSKYYYKDQSTDKYYIKVDSGYKSVEDGTIVTATIVAGVDQFGNTYSGATVDTILTELIYGEAEYKLTHTPSVSYEIWDGRSYQPCGTVTYYYKDKYDNHYEILGSGSWNSGNAPRVYTMTPVGGGSNSTMTIAKDNDKKNKTALPSYSAGWTHLNHEDEFGTRYMFAGEVYRCTYGIESFYQFTYELNQATRSGYRLTGWHNTHVPLTDDKYPSAGVNRTMLLFVNLNESYLGDTYKVAYKEALRTSNEGDFGLYITKDYTAEKQTPSTDYPNGYPRIDNTSDPSKMYTVGYEARWAQLDYTVTIGNEAHGKIQAYYVGSDGVRTEIIGSKTNVHYGDRVELSYSNTGNYQFSKWSISGEYSLNPQDKPSTTLIVQGDCTISVNDIGDRVIHVEVKFDDGKMSVVERERTTAYVLNKDTGEYKQLEYISNYSDEYEFYRGYIPLGTYTLCLRYDMGQYGQTEYELKGDMEINADGDVSFAFYVLSARIIDAVYVYDDGGVLKEEVVDTCVLGDGLQLLDLGNTYHNGVTSRDIGIIIVDESGNQVFRVSKYTGVIQDFVNNNSAAVINNPYDMIPPVRFVVAPGYQFSVYEGFPESAFGDYFAVNDTNRYEYGTTANGNAYWGRFDLNWTRYDKPADVIVKIWKADVNINYSIDSPATSAETDWNNTHPTKHVDYGVDLGKEIPAAVLGDKTNIGWYYTGMTNVVSGSDVLAYNTLARFGLGGTPVIAWDSGASVYKDQYGNEYSTSSSSSLTSYNVFQETRYKMVVGGGNYMYVQDPGSGTGNWAAYAGSMDGKYYKDIRGLHYATADSPVITLDARDSHYKDQYGNVYGSADPSSIQYYVVYKEVNTQIVPSALKTVHYFKDTNGYWNLYTTADTGEKSFRCYRALDTACNLYAKLAAAGNVKDVTINVQMENVDDPGHPIQVLDPVVFTLSRTVSSDPFTGTYSLVSIPGCTGTPNLTISPSVNNSVTGDVSSGITISVNKDESEDVTVTIVYQLNSLTLSWNGGWESDPTKGLNPSVSASGWSYSAGTLSKTGVKYGESVLLPYKLTGNDIIGWTVTGGGTITHDDYHCIIYYTYEGARLVLHSKVWNGSEWEDCELPMARYLHPYEPAAGGYDPNTGKYDYSQRYILSGFEYKRVGEGSVPDIKYTYVEGGFQFNGFTYYYYDNFNGLWKTISPSISFVYSTQAGVEVSYKIDHKDSDKWYRLAGSEWEACAPEEIPVDYYYKLGNAHYLRNSGNDVYYYLSGSTDKVYPITTITTDQNGNQLRMDQFGNQYDRDIFCYNAFYENATLFRYTMGPNDTGTATLTPSYPADNVNVTFNTYKNTFEGTNGYQSITIPVARGSTLEDGPQFDSNVNVEMRIKRNLDTNYIIYVNVRDLETHRSGDVFADGSVTLHDTHTDRDLTMTYAITTAEDSPNTSLTITLSGSERSRIYNGDVIELSIESTYGSPMAFNHKAKMRLTVVAIQADGEESFPTVNGFESRKDAVGNELIWFISSQSAEIPVIEELSLEDARRPAVTHADQFGNEYSGPTLRDLKYSYVYNLSGDFKIDYSSGSPEWYKWNGASYVACGAESVYYYKYSDDSMKTRFVYDDALYKVEFAGSSVNYYKYKDGVWEGCDYPNVYYSYADRYCYRYEKLENDRYAPIFTEGMAKFNGNIAYTARWDISKLTFKFNTDSPNAEISATKDSAANPLTKGEPGNSVEYNSEIIVTIRPASGETIDLEATIAASTADYPFGQPKKLSEDRGYRWSFLLTESAELNIRFKKISVDINFYVNGNLVDPTGSYKVQVNFDGLTDQFGNVYKYDTSSAEYVKSESYIYYNTGDVPYRIIYGSPDTYREWNESTSMWVSVNSLPGTYPGDYYYKDTEGSKYTYSTATDRYTKQSDSSVHTASIVYNYGRNIPMYSIVRFGNYQDGSIGWFTDSACTIPYTVTNDPLTETKSLYTYDNYIVVLYDSDGKGATKFKLTVDDEEAVNKVVSIPAYMYDMISKHKDHIMVGWAVKNGSDKNVFTYVTEDKIPVADFGENKWLDLYAYYLSDGTKTSVYNGADQSTSIGNDDTDMQVDMLPANISVVYSKTVDFDKNSTYTASDPGCSASITYKHAGSNVFHYWVKVTSTKGESPLTRTFVGTAVFSITQFRMYVVAPSAYVMYGGTASVNTSGISYLPIDVAEIPSAVSDDYTVTLKTDEGYATSRSDVGSSRTSVVFNFNGADASSADFIIYRIDGTIAVYDKDTSRFESRGY